VADFLASHYCGVVVGTPNRLGKLVAEDALSLSKVRIVVLDCAPNQKVKLMLVMSCVVYTLLAQLSLVDLSLSLSLSLSQTRADLFAFLGGCCLPGLLKGKFKLALI
jgi:hypothetical protein